MMGMSHSFSNSNLKNMNNNNEMTNLFTSITVSFSSNTIMAGNCLNS